MANSQNHSDNHGQTVAAWTAVIIILVGSTISAIAIIAASPMGFWLGMIVAVLGVVAGAVLRKLGYGQERATLHVGGK